MRIGESAWPFQTSSSRLDNTAASRQHDCAPYGARFALNCGPAQKPSGRWDSLPARGFLSHAALTNVARIRYTWGPQHRLFGLEEAAYRLCLPGVLLSPRIQRILRFAFLMAGVFISSVAASEACSCASFDSPPACELYKKFDIAFVGRAIHVPPNRAGGPVRFRLTQALKGVAGPEGTVLNEESGMSCGYQFEEGQDYVVFAERNAAGYIDIAPCSDTIWQIRVSRTSPDRIGPQAVSSRRSPLPSRCASRQRAAASSARSGSTCLVRQSRRPDRSPWMGRPSFCRVLRMSAEPRASKAATSSSGLPRGMYQSQRHDAGWSAAGAKRATVRASPGAGRLSVPLIRREHTRSVAIADARSCGYAPFAAVFDGEIAGSDRPRGWHAC